MRDADERRNASIITHSSMRCRSTSAHVGCTTKTSVPRMFSSIWNETPCRETAAAARARAGRRRNSRNLLPASARMGAAREQFQLAATHTVVSQTQDWLGREDSNLRIRDPKSRALPLGHAPAAASSCGHHVPTPRNRRPTPASGSTPQLFERGLKARLRQACPQKVKCMPDSAPLVATGRRAAARTRRG